MTVLRSNDGGVFLHSPVMMDNACRAAIELLGPVRAIMREVDFLHGASRTLVVTDLIENFLDETPGTNRMLRGVIKCLGMWGSPNPAPELRWFTRDRKAVREALQKILSWDFDRIVLAHGELILHEPKAALRKAWRWLLG